MAFLSSNQKRWMLLLVTAVLLSSWLGCRAPQIDPIGRGIFVPGSTPVLTPFGNPQVQTLPPVQPAPAMIQGAPVVLPPANPGPAFQQPAAPPPCPDGGCGAQLGQPALQPTGSLVSHHQHGGHHQQRKHTHRPGTLTTTPDTIIAPVGSEVVVLAGICGEDGNYITNQPLEWMLSQDSAGQIVEVGGMDHGLFNQLVPPSSKKFAGDYAWGRTGLKSRIITRGTDTTVDDLEVKQGQTWLSLTSGSEGTSFLTCVAPKHGSWPERKSITRIHWVDGIWSIPLPSLATAGTIHPLATSVVRSSDGTGVPGWTVKYQIVGGVPAEFHPTGAQTAEVETNSQGVAAVELRQPAGQAVAGPTHVRVEIVRPSIHGQREVALESGITTVNWSSPALTIRAIGPRTAGVNQPFNYRIEVTNPGDQVARGVMVSTQDIGDIVEYISSTPKPSQYGNRLEWNLGDVQPGAAPQVIDIQVRSSQRGAQPICFEVSSQSDQLSTEACVETEIAVPCLGLQINGPESARLGEEIPFSFDITNQCERPLENVVVRMQYDPGLEAEGVPNPVELTPIDRILPGETVNLPQLIFRARQGGTQCFNLEVRSNAGDTARARRCVDVENVTQSRVRVDMESQRNVRVGEPVLVRMRVTNVGNVPLDDVTVINSFSRSLTPAQRSAVPQRWIGDDLAFDLGRLEVNQDRTIEVQYDTNRADGDAFSRATVTTPLGASDQTGVSIRIDPPSGTGPIVTPPPRGGTTEPPVGIPADPVGGGLRVGVTALDRAVAVNNNAIFRVSIQNDRPVSDQNLVITLLVPPGTRLQAPDLSQTGLRIAEQRPDGQVRFEPRVEMRAGETLTFNIALQALQAGQATLAVQANSARSPNPVQATGSVSVDP